MTRFSWLALSLVMALSVFAGDDMSATREQDLRNLLIQDCGSCHGLTMKGGLGPALLPERLQDMTAEYLTEVILHGRPGTAMPPWSSLLTPAEARWMADRLLKDDL